MGLTEKQKQSSTGHVLSGIAGSVIGSAGLDRLNGYALQRSEAYKRLLSRLGNASANRSLSKLRRFGAGGALAGLALAPLALGSVGGYLAGSEIFDRVTK
jgi:hypothetical protein